MKGQVEGPVAWLDGDPQITAEIDQCLASGFSRGSRLHHTPRRSVYKLGIASLDPSKATRSSIAFKVHHLRSGVRALREGVKRKLLLSSARREWRALTQLHALGVPVPTPRALGRLPSGDEIVVCDFVEGIPLLDCLTTADEAMQIALLGSLAESLEVLYTHGFRHGDLHVGNLMVLASPQNAREQVILLDVQSATRSRREATRLGDLARLELSLHRAGFSPRARAAFRTQLGAGSSFPAAYALFLQDHIRGRARRVLAIGRRTARAEAGTCRGLRTSRFSNEAFAGALHQAHLLNADPPSQKRRNGRVRLFEIESKDGDLIVKQTEAGSWRRAFADRFRGSAAARAFHNARAIALLEDRAATPLAFAEEYRLGLPFKSWLILERQGEQDLDALRLPPGEPQERLGRAFGRWLAEGHALGLSHRDAKGNNIRVQKIGDTWHFGWVDLEDLTGPAVITRADRIRVWAQIGASLPDAFFRIDARLAAFDAYEERMSYANEETGVPAHRIETLRAIAQASVKRQHRWLGEDCACLETQNSESSAGTR